MFIPASSLPLPRALILTASAILMGACASASGPRSARDADRAGPGDDVVTTAELRRLDPGSTLLDALERERAEFLHPRGSVPTVSIDGSPPTELSVLQTIRVAEVKEVRLVRRAGRSGPAAIRSDGAVVVGDVILVITRP
jgi:hypothetical protein